MPNHRATSAERLLKHREDEFMQEAITVAIPLENIIEARDVLGLSRLVIDGVTTGV